MSCNIIIYNTGYVTTYLKVLNAETVDSVIDDIKSIIKNNDSIDSIMMAFIGNPNWVSGFSDDINDTSIKYLIKIYIDNLENYIKLRIYKRNDNNDTNYIFMYSKHVMINLDYKGNCVDDFLHRGVIPIINNINDLVCDISKRQDIRAESIEYHNTGCYERDFRQTKFIQEEAKKLLENCNKHLERISEFYTKL